MYTNCYLVWDEVSKNCFIIDPADDAVFISEELLRLQLNPVAILLTHGHSDHTGAVLDLKLMYDIPLYASKLDNFLYDKKNKLPSVNIINIDLDTETDIYLGKEKIEIFKTPGHTPGSICFYTNKLLFSGDTIFAYGWGRTDLPYSNHNDLKNSIEKLIKLPKETTVLPGHEDATTIAGVTDYYFSNFR